VPEQAGILAEDIGDFLAHARDELGLSAASLDAYGRDLAQFLAWSEGEKINDPTELTSAHLRSFAASRHRKGLNPRSIQRQLSALRRFFKFLRREGRIDGDPVEGVRAPRVKRRLPRPLDVDQVVALLSIPDEGDLATRDRAMLELFYTSGLRVSELAQLTWDRLDLKRGRILLEETKNGERRVLPLTGLAHELLTRHSKVRRLDTNLVWPSRRDSSRPVSHRNVWLQALKAAEIEDFRFHDLRYSAASYMLMNRASIAELAEVLGHKALQMVKRYSHLSESHARGIVERMNKAVFGGGGNA